MFKGIVLALSACFIWGLIFVIPQFMGSFSAIVIAFGRYWFYGSLSLAVWTRALCLSFLSGYYLWVVLAMRYTSPEIYRPCFRYQPDNYRLLWRLETERRQF